MARIECERGDRGEPADRAGQVDGALAVAHRVRSGRLRGLGRPSVIAERLPKALIHHNVDGEPVHALLRDLDAAWERAAGHGGFGVRQRFLATVDDVRGRWPVEPGPSRWRLGEITLPWTAVAPAPTG